MRCNAFQLAVAIAGAALPAGCVGPNSNPLASGKGAEIQLQASGRPHSYAVKVLFVGNSLTGVNDLPAVVQAMAAAAGKKLACESRILSGSNLEDQWGALAGRRMVTATKWDYLVLQQGPSSRPESQVDLRKWSVTWANEARRVGAKPALYIVWPYRGQQDGFALVSKSYRNAAVASCSIVFPAGEAWAEALNKSPDLPLYQVDGLHPTETGTYLAALVIVGRLTDAAPRRIPPRLKLANGRDFVVPDSQVERLRDAADRALAKDILETPR